MVTSENQFKTLPLIEELEGRLSRVAVLGYTGLTWQLGIDGSSTPRLSRLCFSGITWKLLP